MNSEGLRRRDRRPSPKGGFFMLAMRHIRSKIDHGGRSWTLAAAMACALSFAPAALASRTVAPHRATIIVEVAGGTTLAEGARIVRASGATVRGRIGLIHALAVRARPAQAALLARRHGIAHISRNADV